MAVGLMVFRRVNRPTNSLCGLSMTVEVQAFAGKARDAAQQQVEVIAGAANIQPIIFLVR